MNGMPTNPSSGGWNERMRLIRFRRKRESLRFWTEFKLIPRWGVGLVIVLFLIAQGIAVTINLDLLHVEQRHEIFPPELAGRPLLASLALGGLGTAGAVFIGLVIFVSG